jgi:hypothetical protein
MSGGWPRFFEVCTLGWADLGGTKEKVRHLSASPDHGYDI